LVEWLFEVGVSSADLPPLLAKKTVVSGNRSDVGQPWTVNFNLHHRLPNLENLKRIASRSF
jgi:hypothetical protein